jgi:CheY-like chemotaxis protein
MVCTGRVLIADDEDTFLNSTADLLRDEGCHCDCASDAFEATRKLHGNRYDLLIADIKMPGNPHLELIKEVQKATWAMPVILVTGYPSVDTAIDSVNMTVAAYVVKPLDIDEFLSTVRLSLERSQIHRTICGTQGRLTDLCGQLQGLASSFPQRINVSTREPVGAFVALILQNIAGALSDLGRLANTLTNNRSEHEQWEAVAFTQLGVAHKALTESISVLNETRSLFKSKQLGRLRHKLEMVVDEWPPVWTEATD